MLVRSFTLVCNCVDVVDVCSRHFVSDQLPHTFWT